MKFARLKALVLTMLFIVTGPPAIAQDAGEPNAYGAASRQFDKLVTEAKKSGEMPRLSDKSVAGLLTTMSDTSRFLKSVDYQAKDLGALMDICSKANAVVMSYVLFDLKKGLQPDSDKAARSRHVRRVIENNSLTYHREMAQVQPFLLRCLARQIPLLTDFIAALKPAELTNIRRDGIRKARNGIYTTYLGVFQIANNPKMDENYQIQVLGAMGETATQYASILELPARARLRRLAESVRGTAAPSTRDSLNQIVNAMSDTNCAGLCKY